jgi:tetratricopeptide (TPR) repeat protein
MPLLNAGARVAVIGLLVCAAPGPVFAQVARDPYYEFLTGRRLEARGDVAGALAALERAAAADPKSAEIRGEIAALELRRNRQNEAEKAALAALALDKANPSANRVLGLVFAARSEEGNGRGRALELAREAIPYLERAVTGSATADITLQFTLGRLYLRTGAAEKAVESFGRVVNQNPGSAQARVSLAQAFAAAGDMNSAIETLEEIVAEEPRVAAPLAQYLEQAGRLKEASEAYTRALEANPTSRELKFRRIAMLFNLKDYANAAMYAADAQQQHPDDLRFVQLRARALFETGARTRALELLEAALQSHPGDSDTQFALVGLYRDADREADAERTLRQMLEAQPRNAETLNYLGYLLAERGQKLEEAIDLIERALDLDPGNPSYLDSLGWAHFKGGNIEEAEKSLVPAAQKLPKNSVIQDHLGDVLSRRGRLGDAIAAWNRALEGDGRDIDRTAIQKKIEGATAQLQNAR